MWEEYYDVCVKEVRRLKEKEKEQEQEREAAQKKIMELGQLVISQDDKITSMDIRLSRAIRTISHLLKNRVPGK